MPNSAEYLAGLRAGLGFALSDPDLVPRAIEIADLELLMLENA
jgi:hypothetical protein